MQAAQGILLVPSRRQSYGGPWQNTLTKRHQQRVGSIFRSHAGASSGVPSELMARYRIFIY